MSQTILFPKNNSVPFVLSFHDIINSGNWTTWRLPGNDTTHIFSSFLTYRLHETVLIGVTFGRTDESTHHEVLCDSFVSLGSLVIHNEVISVCSPAKTSISDHHLLVLVNRNFIDEIILVVELNKRSIFCQQIYVFLRWWYCSCYNTVLILGLYIDFSFAVYSKYAAILSHHKNRFLFDHIFQQQNFALKFIERPPGLCAFELKLTRFVWVFSDLLIVDEKKSIACGLVADVRDVFKLVRVSEWGMDYEWTDLR